MKGSVSAAKKLHEIKMVGFGAARIIAEATFRLDGLSGSNPKMKFCPGHSPIRTWLTHVYGEPLRSSHVARRRITWKSKAERQESTRPRTPNPEDHGV
jgi:hypothetical protein